MGSALSHALTDLLANLRAIHWHAWNTHWKAQGGDSYSDHLLFQRIYAGDGGGPSIDDQIDGLGERIIALFGNKSVDGVEISRKAADIHQRIQDMGRVAGALALEKEARRRVAAAADQMAKGPAELRISLDNFVRELADARSTVIYLLQQRLAGGKDAYGQPSNVIYLDDYRDLGTVVDEETEARFTEEQRGKLLGWAILGLVGYAAYWNYKQGPNPPWQHLLWGDPYA
tara:strand:+ start:1575 stop:2261 length:687 start_codon:yes stop_codon:yes gene_type:complete